MSCSAEATVSKLERALRSAELRGWLASTARAFASALAGVAERRMTDVVAALFLAQVGSSVYAAARAAGAEPRDALEEALAELCRIYQAAVELLRSSYEAGSLEESFESVVRWLGGGPSRGAGEAGG